MKVSENFSASDFLSSKMLSKVKSKGQDPRRYINPRIISVMECYRSLLNELIHGYMNDVSFVYIIGNKSGVQTRGLRSQFDKSSGAEMSDHKFGQAQDSDIMIKFTDGTSAEIDYKLLARIIDDNNSKFFDIGITMVEDVRYAPTWSHISIAWTGLDKVKVIKP